MEITIEERGVDLSVVIVSYNSVDLLMLTLASVRRAIEGISAEVFVVDNASAEDVVGRVEREASWVQLMALGSNVGFSAANNKALREAKGDVVVVLNPDTVVPVDFFRRVIDHFKSEGEGAGAIGVRMVNGEGHYLRESKRGYTDLRTSFFKMTGLWRLAKKSAVVNAYYIGQHDEKDVCPAPILSGACIAFRRDLMKKVGDFDESYFMYSEDIDLSWRMNEASRGNIYRGDLSIIHFKGQSTPRKRKYIGYFYKSMLKFARKYEYPKHNWVVNMMTKCGIVIAYGFAMARCLVLRHLEFARSFKAPKRVLVVKGEEEWGMLEHTGSRAYEAIVFDIDSDLGRAIEYMRAHAEEAMYGFRNLDSGQMLVFYNNRCHDITRR